jgi:hypothetical protein
MDRPPPPTSDFVAPQLDDYDNDGGDYDYDVWFMMQSLFSLYSSTMYTSYEAFSLRGHIQHMVYNPRVRYFLHVFFYLLRF